MALVRYPELQPGSELLARSFSDAVPALTIRVSSSELARGGTAVILKGDVISPWPAVVALKVVMDVPREDSNHYNERIRREIAAVQQIQHRFILPFLGVVLGGTYTVLVSQFMENGDLLEYFRATPDADRRSLIIQVADAVNYLHTKAGLVHGDLKCQNVLVSSHGEAQLADFGLSTIVDKSLSTDTTTLGIRQSYTLQFAAPELLSDEAKSSAGRTRSKTTQTDVFAFGRLVLQAFTGTVPWPDLPLHTVFHKVLKNVTPERREEALLLGLDDKWWSVCIACWRSAPRERPTMEKIMLELCETSDRLVSRPKPLKPWSLPSIITSLRRVRPSFRAAPQLGPIDWVTTGDLSSISLPSVIEGWGPIDWVTTGDPVSDSLPTVIEDCSNPSRNAVEQSQAMKTSRDVIICRHCAQPIVGIRYQCATCPSLPESYDLCSECEAKSYLVHDGTHVFFKLPRPVKHAIQSPYPFVPSSLYLQPAGLFPSGMRGAGSPELYLAAVRHKVVLCDDCVRPIVGKWYRCAYCGKDLCGACEEVDVHNDAHLFVVFKTVVDMARFREFTDLERPAPLIQYAVY